MQRAEYALYDLDGIFIINGTIDELSNYLYEQGYKNKNQSFSYYASRHATLYKKYKVVQTQESRFNTSIKKKKGVSDESVLENLLFHLKKYGNTVSSRNPYDFAEQIHEAGIHFKSVKRKDNYDTTYYYVEVL